MSGLVADEGGGGVRPPVGLGVIQVDRIKGRAISAVHTKVYQPSKLWYYAKDVYEPLEFRIWYSCYRYGCKWSGS